MAQTKFKELKINLLFHKYEFFKMKDTESISELLIRFIDIVNSVKALSGDMPLVNNILRALSKNWVTT